MPTTTIVPTWLPACRRRSREIWEALFQLDRCDCFRTLGEREREREGGERERGIAGIGVEFQAFFSRSICQPAAERKPIIEINGLKIIQAFLLKKERERKNWLFKARPNPTTHATKEEGLKQEGGGLIGAKVFRV